MTRSPVLILCPCLTFATLACGSSKAASDDGADARAGEDGDDTTEAGDAGNPADGGGGVGADGGALVAIPLTACIPNVYTAGMVIGGSQSFQLLLDTGSTTLGVATVGCTSCTDAGVSNLYQPGPTAVDQHLAVDAGFGALAFSGFSGEIYQDWVGAAASPEMARVKFVAITQESDFLVGTCGPGGPPRGVVGFAPSAAEDPGTNGFFDQVVASGVVPNVFATRLCSTGGTLWLGGYDPAFTTKPAVYTPMTLTGGQFATGLGVYTVNLASITVLGTVVPVATESFPGTFLDTGSSISSLPPAALSALSSAIATSPGFSGIFGAAASSFFSSPDNHVQLSQTKDALDAALPPLTLTFGSNPAVSMQATATESYLVTYGGGEWSPALGPRTPDESTFPGIAAILGPPILRSNVIIFDRANQRIGFAPHTACP